MDTFYNIISHLTSKYHPDFFFRTSKLVRTFRQLRLNSFTPFKVTSSTLSFVALIITIELEIAHQTIIDANQTGMMLILHTLELPRWTRTIRCRGRLRAHRHNALRGQIKAAAAGERRVIDADVAVGARAHTALQHHLKGRALGQREAEPLPEVAHFARLVEELAQAARRLGVDSEGAQCLAVHVVEEAEVAVGAVGQEDGRLELGFGARTLVRRSGEESWAN